MLRRFVASAGVLVLSLLGLVSGPQALAASNWPVALTVTESANSVAAGGQVVLTFHFYNTTSRWLRELRLAQFDSEQTQGPGSRWIPALGLCGAASGTAYCGVRDLAPHGELVERFVLVAASRLGPAGIPTIGRRAGIGVFLVQGPEAGPLSRIVRVSLPIVASTSLPNTGIPVTLLVSGALGLLTGGALVLRVPRRRPY